MAEFICLLFHRIHHKRGWSEGYSNRTIGVFYKCLKCNRKWVKYYG